MDWKYNHFAILQLSRKEALKKYSLSKNSKYFSPKWKVTLNDYNHLLFIGKLNYISSFGNYPSRERSLEMTIFRYKSYPPPSVRFVSSFSAFSLLTDEITPREELHIFLTHFSLLLFFWIFKNLEFKLKSSEWHHALTLAAELFRFSYSHIYCDFQCYHYLSPFFISNFSNTLPHFHSSSSSPSLWALSLLSVF